MSRASKRIDYGQVLYEYDLSQNKTVVRAFKSNAVKHVL